VNLPPKRAFGVKFRRLSGKADGWGMDDWTAFHSGKNNVSQK
jgi:hypothetical protein